MEQLKVVVGSESALKIRAVEAALAALNLSGTVTGCKAESRVSQQPVGIDEMRWGATNRAEHAMHILTNCDLYIGIENGIVGSSAFYYDAPFVSAVFVSEGGDAIWGTSIGTFFPIPGQLVRDVKDSGSELGVAVQKLAGGGEKDPIAYFSKGLIPREQILAQAIMCAIVNAMHRDLYK